MKKQSIYILIIISLVLINIFTWTQQYFLRKEQTIFALSNSINQTKNNDELQTFKQNLRLSIMNSNLKVEELVVKDSLNKEYSINEIFSNKEKETLVFRFSQMHCESCINASMQIARMWVDSIGVNNIAFWGNHRNNRIFFKNIPFYGLQGVSIYNCPQLKLPVEELRYPYFFLIDRNLRITNVFVPNKSTPHITNLYLKSVSEKLNKKY